MSHCDICGYLQQQYLDADGLYRYNKRHYRLSVADATLRCANDENGEDIEVHDLTMAYSAKKLPSASDATLGGVPFSLVWRSGKIWLFLAPNSEACAAWVQALDAAIHGGKLESPSKSASAVASSNENKAATTSTKQDTQQPGDSSTKQLVPSLLGRVDGEATGLKQDTQQPRGSLDSPAATPQSAWRGLGASTDFTNVSDTASTRTFSHPHESAALAAAELHMQTSPFSDPATEVSPRALRLPPPAQPQQQRREHSHGPLRFESADAVLRGSKDSENGLPSEVERRVLQVEHESYEAREAALQMLKRQHNLEMSVLRADFESQREKLNEMFVRERQIRERAEEREVAAQRTARDWENRYKTLYSEMQELSKQHNDVTAVWESEKAKLTAEIRTLTRQLQEEVANSASRVRSEMRTELVATTQDYESRIEQTRQQVAQTLKLEFEREKVRHGLELVERHQQELQAALANAHEQRVREVEAVRKTFMQREEQTAQDIEKLQSLHERRVRDLERMCDTLKQKLAEAQTRIVELTNENQECAQRARKDLQSSALHAQAATARTEELQEQLDQLGRQKAEAENQHAVMRERLTQVLDERRIERAEALDLKRQLAELTAESDRYRRLAASTDHHAATIQVRDCSFLRNGRNDSLTGFLALTCATQAETQIMQEELAMLEHENARLRRECETLAHELSKVDKFLYGGKKSAQRTRSRRPT